MVKSTAVFLDKDNALRFSVKAANGDEFDTTREHLRVPSNPDIGWIPTSIPEYWQSSRCISDEDVRKITSPDHLSPLQQEFLSLHHRLLHLPMPIMLRMSRLGILPKRFCKLRNDLPPCVDCLFGRSHQRPWRTKASSTASGGVLQSFLAKPSLSTRWSRPSPAWSPKTKVSSLKHAYGGLLSLWITKQSGLRCI